MQPWRLVVGPAVMLTAILVVAWQLGWPSAGALRELTLVFVGLTVFNLFKAKRRRQEL